MSKHTFTYPYVRDEATKARLGHWRAVCACGWTRDLNSTQEAFEVANGHKLDVLLELAEKAAEDKR